MLTRATCGPTARDREHPLVVLEARLELSDVHRCLAYESSSTKDRVVRGGERLGARTCILLCDKRGQARYESERTTRKPKQGSKQRTTTSDGLRQLQHGHPLRHVSESLRLVLYKLLRGLAAAEVNQLDTPVQHATCGTARPSVFAIPLTMTAPNHSIARRCSRTSSQRLTARPMNDER
jgi:hypothetical protein